MLFSLNNKITNERNEPLGIRIKSERPPRYNIDSDMKQKVKSVLGKHYISETNALDLSKFYSDPGNLFVITGLRINSMAGGNVCLFLDLAPAYFVPLFRGEIMEVVMDIVYTVAPNISALRLDSNKIERFNGLKVLKKFKNLKILHLADNHVCSFAIFFPHVGN